MEAQAQESSARVGLHSQAVVRTQGHDLESIFAQYMEPVYRFLYRRVGNREDAEDLTSQVFLKASRQLDGGRTDASVASWLFTVARTVLADHWRTFYRAPSPRSLDDEIVAANPHCETGDDHSQATEQMLEAVLQALPPRYRRVLELRFLGGYSVDEAAREMDVTPGNLKVLQHRALARAATIGFPGPETDRLRGSSPVDAQGAVTVNDQGHEERDRYRRVYERNTA